VIRRCCGGRLPGSESAPTPQSPGGGAARAWRQRPAPKSVLDCPRSARPGAADSPGGAFAARRHNRRLRSTRRSRRRYNQPSPPPNAPNPLFRLGFRYRSDSASPHRPGDRMIHPMQYAVLHWISVISSWVEFLAERLGVGGIATCSGRSRLCGNRRKEPVRARGPEIRRDVPIRLIVKGVAREHRWLAVTDAELLLRLRRGATMCPRCRALPQLERLLAIWMPDG
jgi:hypothetical protein